MEIKTPTQEQILEAAKSSPEAKKALEKLFPDVFKDAGEILINISYENSEYTPGLLYINSITPLVWKHETRDCLVLTGCGLSWEVRIDDQSGHHLLIPTRK